MKNENRTQIEDDAIELAINYIRKKLTDRLREKGRGVFISKHEMLGVITEEYDELIEAIRDDTTGSHLFDELMDMAVASIFSLACIYQEEKDNSIL